MDTIERIMLEQCNRELLRFAVMRAIFCPVCQNILDTRRAALVGSTVICRTCEEKSRAKFEARGLEIIRGYKPRKPRKPAPTAEELRAKEERKGDRMAAAYVDRATGNLFDQRKGKG